MKRILIALLLYAGVVCAEEPITIYSPYSPSHSGTPAMKKILDEANRAQSKYKFILDFKPGGEQIIALRALEKSPSNTLAIIAPKYVEHIVSGRLNPSNYIPVYALGDACWAVISNLGSEHAGIESLATSGEIIVGGVGFGNAAHLTGLEIGEKIGANIRYIVFKSNYDALILMAGQDSINLVLERVSSFNAVKSQNAALKILGMSCPARSPALPNIKTLKEQGINAPYVFNITVAHTDMPLEKIQNISNILNNATLTVGEDVIATLSDMTPPIFRNISIQDYYNSSMLAVKQLLEKHKKSIPNNHK